MCHSRVQPVVQAVHAFRETLQSGLNQVQTSPTLPGGAKRPSDSLLRVLLPFGSNTAFRAGFVNQWGHLRFGMILEELDFFSCKAGETREVFSAWRPSLILTCFAVRSRGCSHRCLPAYRLERVVSHDFVGHGVHRPSGPSAPPPPLI